MLANAMELVEMIGRHTHTHAQSQSSRWLWISAVSFHIVPFVRSHTHTHAHMHPVTRSLIFSALQGQLNVTQLSVHLPASHARDQFVLRVHYGAEVPEQVCLGVEVQQESERLHLTCPGVRSDSQGWPQGTNDECCFPRPLRQSHGHTAILLGKTGRIVDIWDWSETNERSTLSLARPLFWARVLKAVHGHCTMRRGQEGKALNYIRSLQGSAVCCHCEHPISSPFPRSAAYVRAAEGYQVSPAPRCSFSLCVYVCVSVSSSLPMARVRVQGAGDSDSIADEAPPTPPSNRNAYRKAPSLMTCLILMAW